MGLHTFTAGEVLTAANVNNFLMNQTTIVCTSGTRPSSPVTGMVIFETDTSRFQVYNGTTWVQHGGIGAYQTYSPNWSAGTSPSLSTNSGHYQTFGKTVHAQGYVVASGTATSGVYGTNAPIAIGGLGTNAPLGTAVHFVAATSAIKHLTVLFSSGTTLIKFWADGATAAYGPSVAVGDSIAFNLTYETT